LKALTEHDIGCGKNNTYHHWLGNGAFMKTLGCVVVLLCAFAVPARAQVYSGCNVPTATSGHTWYIDPVNGKSPAAGGNGSQTSPWNSLTGAIGGAWGTAGFSVPGYTRPLLSSVPYYHVINTGPVDVADQVGKPPVQPGDTLYLMSGNYGDITLGNYNLPTTNSDWVTVEAAPTPGQVPVFTTLYIRSTNKWVFNGIKVQSIVGTNNNGNALVTLTDQGPSYPTTDIVLENLLISSADSTAGWTQAQWIARARYGYQVAGLAGNGTNGMPNTNCISLAGSHIQNVRTAAILSGNNMLFTNNIIDHFGDDGIDYAASNLAITHNTLHDNLDIGDGNHEDAMQGQNGALPAGAALNYFSNILIDSNLILRQTDPTLAFPTYLQGIDAFDEDWTNVTVTNNVVVTSACWGISFASIHNSLIADNTVVNDGFGLAPGCLTSISAGGATHEGPISSNTVVRNNLSSQLNIDNRDPGVVANNNVVLCCTGPYISWYVNGVLQYISQPGTYGNGNIIETEGTKGEFVNFNPAALTYTLMLKSGATAIGAATAGAPTVDILGATRASPYAAGAYSFPY
jgi:hypothetical protein